MVRTPSVPRWCSKKGCWRDAVRGSDRCRKHPPTKVDRILDVRL